MRLKHNHMNRIFQNRLREFIGRVDQAIRAKPIEGATNTKELINLLHNKKSNIILFPSHELTNLVDSPCPGMLKLLSKELCHPRQQGGDPKLQAAA